MNFLTIVLCLAMNRPYQEYYFVPLISFWFSMQYLVMAVPPVVSKGPFTYDVCSGWEEAGGVP